MQRVYVKSLVGALRAYMPCHQKTKIQNKSNIVTNSIKTFKMVHIKKQTTPPKNKIFWDFSGDIVDKNLPQSN